VPAKNWRLCTQLTASAGNIYDWRPVAYNCTRVAASRVQIVPAGPLPEQLFELKNEHAIEKSENLRFLAKSYISTLCKVRSNLIRRYL
jgi:hypothetical protein